MSFKRYAIIAAVSYHNHQQQQNNSSTTAAAAAAAAKPTIPTSSSSLSPTSTPLPSQLSATTAAATKTTLLFSSSSSATSSATYGSHGANSSSGSSSGSAPAYYGGLSIFHQQNIRSGSSSSSNNGVVGGSGGGIAGQYAPGGATFPTAVNGNVNLLLGGAMLSLVTTILCVVCYCCHRNIKKRTEAAYRQQRQWLESDPNMEIYSVEQQCYETSGMFLGESSDGLSTMPTLHHEPPPSYDAVVAMQEQQLLHQQQQLLLLQQQQHHHAYRTSPPPGYRSSLDVSMLAGATVGAGAATALHVAVHDGYACSNIHINNCGSNSSSSVNTNNNHNNSNSDYCNIEDAAAGTAQVVVRRYDFGRNMAGNMSTLGNNSLLHMKKVWNAQSCCSLQRAEVENMWNAAAAAVAARATHVAAAGGGNSAATTSSAAGQQQRGDRKAMTEADATTTTVAAATTRSTTKLPMNSSLGRRYLNQSLYRRGCPLCGKFRYDADDALSLSTESGLNVMSLQHVADAAVKNVDNENQSNKLNCITSNKTANVADNNDVANVVVANVATNNVAYINNVDVANADDIDDDDDECSCATATTTVGKHYAPLAVAQQTSQEFEQQHVADYENGNTLSSILSSEDVGNFYGATQLEEFYEKADAACSSSNIGCHSKNTNNKNINSNNNTNNRENKVDNYRADTNSSNNNIKLNDSSNSNSNTVTATIEINNTQTDSNANATTTSPTSPITDVTTFTNVVTAAVATSDVADNALLQLETINETHGIVRLDMSQIIDRTGLPSYDGALKLDSSGYV